MESADESFERLEVWRRSHALSIQIYRHLADCRDWGFKDQITRSANSISDNIAEGAERTSKAEFGLGWPNTSSLNGHHFKVFFAGTALWASPVHGHVGPSCARGNTVFRATRSLVVNPAAN